MRQIFFAQGLSIVAIGLGATRTLFLLSAFGPRLFGVYSTLYHSAVLLGAVAGLNTGDYLAKECPGRAIESQRKALRLAFVLATPGTALAIALAALAFLQGWVNLPLSLSALWVLAAAATVNSVLLIFQGYLYGLDRIYAARSLNFFITFGWFFVLVPAWWMGLTVTLAAIFSIWLVVDLLILVVFAVRFRDSIVGTTATSADAAGPHFKDAVSFCIGLYPRALSKSLMSLGDRYALLALGQLGALSVLSVLKEVVGIAANFGNQISSVMSPSYYRVVRAKGPQSHTARSNMARLLWMSMLVTIPAALGMWGFAPDIVRLLHGREFVEMVLWIAPVPLLWNLVTVLERWYIIVPRIGYLAIVRLSTTAVYVLAAYLVAHFVGPDEVAMVMSATFLVMLVALAAPSGLRKAFAWREIPYLPLIALTIVGGPILVFIARWEGLPLGARVAGFGATYAVLAACVVAATPQARAELRRQWKMDVSASHSQERQDVG